MSSTAKSPAHTEARVESSLSHSRAARAPALHSAISGPGLSEGPMANIHTTVMAGNLAIARLLGGCGIHAKLAVSQPDDPDEREADRVAEAFAMNQPVSIIHRKCESCADGTLCGNCDEEPVKRKVDSAGEAHPENVAANAIGALRGGGQPLSAALRAEYEPRLGRDFGQVRVHTGADAARAAQSIHARAYTHGQDIAFAPGEFAPDSGIGRRLLAHELTHVAQQSSGATIVQRQTDPNAKKDDKPPPLPSRPREGARQVWLHHFVVADDRAFMKGEMRRLIGNLGIAGADQAVAEMLVHSDPVRFIPLPAHMAATGAYRPQNQYDAVRQTQEEGLLIELAPMVRSVYLEERTDAIAFLDKFVVQIKANAYDTLDASKHRAEAEKVRYGLSDEIVKTREERRHKEADGGWVTDPAEYKVAYHIADANSPAVKSMQGAAAVLLTRRQDIDAKQQHLQQTLLSRASSCNQGYCPPSVNSEATINAINEEKDKLEKTREDYNRLREILTFQYPIIDRAADLETGSASALADIANSKSPADLAVTLGERIADNLSDIARTREGIGNGWVNIWKLKPLIDLTKRQMESADNPAYERVVNDKVHDEQPNVINAVLEGLALLLLNVAAIALAPVTGGISLGVAAAVNVGLAAKHTIDYLYDKSVAGSDLRRAQALSAEDPSLFWLAVEIVGAVVDVGSAVAAMKTLGPLAKAAQVAKEGKAATETAEAIRVAARNLGKPELAEAILAKAGKAEQAVLEAAGASKTEIDALTKISTTIEKEAGETIGASVRTAAQSDVKVSKAGYLFSCSSPCVILREKYAGILVKDNELFDKLVHLEQDAAKAAKAHDVATVAKDSKALAEAEKDVASVKQAAKDLEESINAKYLKPTAAEGESAAADALKQAQAEEAFAKGKPGSRVDLTELRAKPTPERPPGIAADDPLWTDYEKYYTQRRGSILKNEAGVGRPLNWQEYSDFLGKFRRGTAYQESVRQGLEVDAKLIREGQVAGKGVPMEGMKDPEVLSNVGVAGKPKGETAKFVDQLVVDRATLGSEAPRIEAFSNKSRNFGEIIKAEGDAGLTRQVAADAEEALSKYGGKVEIRRQAVLRPNANGVVESVPFELANKTVGVDKVYLVYDKSLLGDPTKSKQLIEAIESAAGSVKGAGGQKVIVMFK